MLHRRFRLSLILVALVCVVASGGVAVKAQPQPKYCIEVEQFDNFNPSSQAHLLNVESGELVWQPPERRSSGDYASPDGKYLTFVTNNEKDELSLYLKSVETGKVTLLHNNASVFGRAEQVEGYWTSDSKYLVMEKRGGTPYGQSIMVMKPDGSQSHEFKLPEAGYMRIEGLSADSNYIAVTLDVSDEEYTRLYVFSIAEMKLLLPYLESMRGWNAMMPVGWSSQGHKLAYLSDKREIIIWTPENGIEVRTEEALTGIQFYSVTSPRFKSSHLSVSPWYRFWWSADGQYVTITQSYEQFPYQDAYDFLRDIYRVKDGIKMDIPRRYERQVILHWSADNWITIADLNEEPTPQSILASINITTGERKIISEQSQFTGNISTDKRHLIFNAKDENAYKRYKIIIYETTTRASKVIYQIDDAEPAFNALPGIYQDNLYWSPDNTYTLTEWTKDDLPQKAHNLVITKSDGSNKRTLVTTNYWGWISEHWLLYTIPDAEPESKQVRLELINLQTGKVIEVGIDPELEFEQKFYPVSVSPDGTLAVLIDNQPMLVPFEKIAPKPTSRFRGNYRSDSRNYIDANDRMAWSLDSSMLAYLDVEQLVVVSHEGKELRRIELAIDGGTTSLMWLPCPN